MNHSSILLINLAGLPATIELSGTSLVTTLPAPTMEFSPTVTLGSIVDAIPIHAFFLMWIGFACVALLFSGLKSWLRVVKLTLGAMNTPSSKVIPPPVHECAQLLDYNSFSNSNVFAIVNIEWRHEKH